MDLMSKDTYVDYLVVGAGPAGIAAARTLQDAGKQVVIYEKQTRYGGLCGSFQVDGHTFDKFVHLSFAPDDLRNKWFNSSTLIRHKPEAANFYNDVWLKHPAITNLAPLSFKQKFKILASFLQRQPDFNPSNYYDWTCHVYGKYFADKFMSKYTRKYWGVYGADMNTSWVGPRFHKPTAKEILSGMSKKNERAFFYVNDMYYPMDRTPADIHETTRSGYVQILDKPAAGLNIHYNMQCSEIDPVYNECTFNGHHVIRYKHLILTIPMPEILMLLTTLNSSIKSKYVDMFKHTCGYMISMVFDESDIADNLWFYVYDENIPPARFYSPSLCSGNSDGRYSTLQGEIYYAAAGVSEAGPLYSQRLIADTISQLHRLGINADKLIKLDCRSEKYANIIFDDETDEAKQYVNQRLIEYDIVTCGRFGAWEYLWSHQAFQSGIDAANKLI